MAVAAAEMEMENEFMENCTETYGSTPPLDHDAHLLLHDFFAINIGALLDNSLMEWEGKHRKFALACAAGLGRSLGATAKKTGSPIDVSMVRAVTRDMIPCWERVCPLPPTPDQRIPDREGQASSEPWREPLMGCLLRARIGMDMP